MNFLQLQIITGISKGVAEIKNKRKQKHASALLFSISSYFLTAKILFETKKQKITLFFFRLIGVSFLLFSSQSNCVKPLYLAYGLCERLLLF